jgi:hypothetical protein
MREPTTRTQGRSCGLADRGIVIDIGMTENGGNRGDTTGPDDQLGDVGSRDWHTGGGVP